MVVQNLHLARLTLRLKVFASAHSLTFLSALGVGVPRQRFELTMFFLDTFRGSYENHLLRYQKKAKQQTHLASEYKIYHARATSAPLHSRHKSSPGTTFTNHLNYTRRYPTPIKQTRNITHALLEGIQHLLTRLHFTTYTNQNNGI